MSPRSMTALVGESGCGKTSLLRAIAGFEVPSEGIVRIDGTTVSGPGVWVEPRHRHVGMVFQQGALFPHLDVWENVQFGLKGARDRADRTADALRLVGLEGFEKRYPDALSGGQQQRVALARAIAPSPKVVLLDEPFGGLDASLRQRVRDDVCAILGDAGVTSILVTHDQQEALSVAERVAVMHAGRILQVGDPASIYHRPATLAVAAFVGEGQLIPCTIRSGKSNILSVFWRRMHRTAMQSLLVRPGRIRGRTGRRRNGRACEVRSPFAATSVMTLSMMFVSTME
jgi:iron(III) transport system ATP-binding protein